MKKLLVFMMALVLVLSSCNDREQVTREKQDVSEALYPFNGFTVRSKSLYYENGIDYCNLQLTKSINGKPYSFNVDSLPGWVYEEYDLDDTIKYEIPVVEETKSDIKEDSAGQRTIIIEGVEYIITQKE